MDEMLADDEMESQEEFTEKPFLSSKTLKRVRELKDKIALPDLEEHKKKAQAPKENGR